MNLPPVNSFVLPGRLKKALELARVLRDGGFRPDAIREFQQSDWQTWADKAKVKLPSETTRGMVYAMLAKLWEPLMNRSLQKGALRAAERFIKAELEVRQRSAEPTPTEAEQASIREAADTLAIVQRAIVDAEVNP